jgi:hypothetical protein
MPGIHDDLTGLGRTLATRRAFLAGQAGNGASSQSVTVTDADSV